MLANPITHPGNLLTLKLAQLTTLKMNYKDRFQSQTTVRLLQKAEVEKRGAFLAGAAWAFELLDKKHPELNLQAILPQYLEEAAKDVPADANQPASNIIV